MKKIEMWKCSDGSIIQDEQEAQKHENNLTIRKEVEDYLDETMGDVADYTRNSQREPLILHWNKLKKYFLSGDLGKSKDMYNIIMDGLQKEDVGYKQWCLEELLKLVVEDFDETLNRYNWDRGVAS